VAAVCAGPLKVASVEAKPLTRNPYPPFMTSTLQQEASRKLGFGARQTMSHRPAALRGRPHHLYAHRRARHGARGGQRRARRHRGPVRAAYVPDKPRVYKTKAKNAQEAHECIRPTDMARAPDAMDPAGERPAPPLRADLEARHRQPDGRRRLERTTIEITGGPSPASAPPGRW
jgi:DNA topoisomerase-1